jgi:heavy metal sensor kinase
MFDSLRARLLVWYTAILAAVIAVFGATVCYLAWRARVADVDRAIWTRAHALSASLQPAADGTFDLSLPAEASGRGTPSPLDHALWNAQGRLIDRSNPEIDVPVPAAAGARTRAGRREVVVRTDAGVTILVGRDLVDVRAQIWSLAGTIGSVGLLAMALSLAGGWWLVGRALSPIDRISRTAREMVGGNFAARIPIERVETELGHLARALNEAFDRLHASLVRQRRFTADASHELRTPLATLSTEVQWVLGRDRSPDDYRAALDVCARQASRMQAVVERLLALARAESGAAQDRSVDLQLDAVVHRVVDDLAPLAESRRVAVSVDAAPVVVRGDPDRLVEAVTNVVANAIQYNVDEGRVDVVLTNRSGAVELSVSDTGMGISGDDLPRVFDPFFRADPARSRDAGGAGLGLAVTRSIIERHGGSVACRSRPESGTTVVMSLPKTIPGVVGSV